jgi:hypothetical protein
MIRSLLLSALLLAGPLLLSAAGRSGAPLVFLDCDRCDVSFIRREIPFVNWVRDREDAVVHVLITDQGTAAGGREYELSFLGLRGNAGTDNSLHYVAPQSFTEDEERTGLAGILKIGLLPYLTDTPIVSRLAVSYEDPGDETEEPSAEHDPWDSWVFEIQGAARGERESQRTEISLDGGFSADRVTEDWRIRNYLDLDYDEDRFESEGLTSTSTSHNLSFWSAIVRSVGPHWSVGISGDIWSATYDNAQLGLRLAPALEYSYWPYAIDDKKRLTFAYRVGNRTIEYRERTIYGRLKESRFDQSLDIDLQLTQPWGQVRSSLSGRHYFHDFERYRVEAWTRLSVRLFRGLSLDWEAGVERVNDQLGLAAGGASLEEVLLRRRELATDYEMWGRIGLSYTFGSIYNNVVNSRL